MSTSKAAPKKAANKRVPNSTTISPPTPPQETGDYAPTAWGAIDHDFVVPSGQRCRIRNLGLQDIIEAGLMDKLNTLQGVVGSNIRKGQGQPPIDPAKLLTDKRTMMQFSDLVDQITCMVVTVPKVLPIPAENEERIPDAVYVDAIGLNDKVEIFNESLGGLKQLETFRGRSSEPA